MLQYSDFIAQHLNDDPRDLALRQSRYPNVDMPYVVQQISAWQTAKRKLPLWAETEGIEFPVHLSMEQCSSQLTAEYKAKVVASYRGGQMTDLTAGFGVDAVMIGRNFDHLNYVERNEALCLIAQNNLPLLGMKDFSIVNGDATEVLTSLPHQSLIYLDPARRDEHGGKTVQISDCTPNVAQMQERLLEKADVVMIKLSPMLDISNITRELNCVKEIHVVSVAGECKELLVVASQNSHGENIRIVCVNLKPNGEDEIFAFDPADERVATCHYLDDSAHLVGYLYEPNSSIMKAGCFRSIAHSFDIVKLHPSSHLYTSDTFIPHFPGRTFRIVEVYSPKDKALKTIKKANLTVRNFPSSVAELRKRLKLSEGGENYLFATTLANNSKVVINAMYTKIIHHENHHG